MQLGKTLIALAVVFLAGTSLSAGPATPPAPSRIVVRVYNYVGASPAILDAALDSAAQAFAPAGIAVQWKRCPITHSTDLAADFPCVGPLQANEHVLRILDQPRTGLSPNALGFAFVDRRARKGVLATVFTGRTQPLALHANLEFGWLLGRVMAHELGHVLLGTLSHAEDGLMRAAWSSAWLQRAGQLRLEFADEEISRMRAAIAVRAPQPQAVSAALLMRAPLQ